MNFFSLQQIAETALSNSSPRLLLVLARYGWPHPENFMRAAPPVQAGGGTISDADLADHIAKAFEAIPSIQKEF